MLFRSRKYSSKNFLKKSAIKRWLCFPTGYFYFSPTGRDIVFVMSLVVPIEVLAESQYEAAATRMLARLSSDPAMKDALLARLRANCSKRRCRDEDMQMGAELAASGVRRLDAPTLVTRARLITIILKNVDEKSCAAIVRGSLTATRTALEQLEPSILDAWMEVSFRAVTAELRNVPPRKLMDSEVQHAYQQFSSLLTEQELQRFRALPNDESKYSTADTCWTTRLTYEKLPMLPEPHRSVMAIHMVQD